LQVNHRQIISSNYFSQIPLAKRATEGRLTIVPLNDDFGDWATPKKSMAGHFFGNQKGEGFSLQ
jgi:hypothetical protein